MSAIIDVRQLDFAWTRQRQSWFSGLNLTLHGGHIYGLLGRNGAGKTTLLKLLSGCLRPKAGQVLFHAPAGRGGNTAFDISRREPQSLAEIVFVPETVTLPGVSILDFGSLAGSLYPRFRQERYAAHLQALAVPRDGLLARLSFGQRRKAHIAFALATEASVILLDEPTNGLDIDSQYMLRQLLAGFQTPHSLMVVSTHHVREFDNVIDEVIVLDHGQVLAQAAVGTITAEPDYQGLEAWYAVRAGLGGQAQLTGTAGKEYRDDDR